jgi:hypothetical protein
VIKLVNCPSKATPAGPVKTAKTLAEIKVAIIFIKVEMEVKDDTFINWELSSNLIFAFNRFGGFIKFANYNLPSTSAVRKPFTS